MRKVALEDAIGLPLAHDITEVKPEEGLKRCAFKRGHIVTEGDLEHLRRLGKHSLYVQNEAGDEVHEDEAARTVGPIAAGENVRFDEEPTEGKINFYAACDGVFMVDVERLHRINALEIPSFPTIHTNYPVKEGKRVAAFRIVPLTCDRSIVDEVRSILQEPILRVAPYVLETAGIVVTGNEVYEGLVDDAFTDRLSGTLGQYGVEVTRSAILPDVRESIGATIESFADTCDIVFVTGGTSVDPDDVTVNAMIDAGVRYEVKGAPIQPGNNLTIGYRGDIPVCAVPAAALFYSKTSLDVFLPRLLAGQKIPGKDIHRAGHGGLCHFCKVCHFPCCPLSAPSQ
jgi:molybdenum cofactor synthesis domain-containing protein